MKLPLFFIFFIFLSSCMQAQNLDVDFGKGKGGQDWQIINDGVMGGLSKSSPVFSKNAVTFKGKLSLKNNGGFASYRKPFSEYDLSSFGKIEIRCRGNGGTFTLMFETSPRFFDPYFKYEFSPEDEWQIFECQLKDLKERRLLKDTGNFITSKDLENIIRFGIIKSDKKTDDFELEIDYIKFK